MPYKVDIDNFSQDDWERYAGEFADYSIYQTWSYQQTRAEKDNQQVNCVVIKDENGEVATMGHIRIRTIKAIGLKVGYIQWGPLVRAADGTSKCHVEALKALRSYYVGPKVNVLRIVPNVCGDETGQKLSEMLVSSGFQPTRSVRPYHTMLFPLNITEDQIRSRFHRKWRSSLRRAERNNIEIKEGTDEEYFKVLDRLYMSAQKQKGFKGLDMQLFIRTQQMLPPRQKMNVVLAYYNGQPLTADVTSYLGDTAVGIFQASSKEGLRLGASYLVWWKALLSAKRAGMKRYDLGGVDPKNNPNVFEFKSRMGAHEIFHIGAFEACAGSRTKAVWTISEKVYNLVKGKF